MGEPKQALYENKYLLWKAIARVIAFEQFRCAKHGGKLYQLSVVMRGEECIPIGRTVFRFHAALRVVADSLKHIDHVTNSR